MIQAPNFTPTSSIPTLAEFNPKDVPYQFDVLKDIRRNFHYASGQTVGDSLSPGGVHQVLLSGSVGSAKSLLMAHIVITHCLFNPGAVAGIGRLTMPSLKDTLLDVILKHLGRDIPYVLNRVKGSITFANGSKILSFSWADGNFSKFRSYEFSLFAIEELTENDDKEFYTEILLRVGRLKHVEEKLLICATNPDDPAHWAYKHFITGSKTDPTIHVYYSKTRENKFLPASYITTLEKNLDEKMAQRMLEGVWLSIAGDVVYYSYTQEGNFRDFPYAIDTDFTVHLSFDFNIGVGKPMSCVFYQIDRQGNFHFFEEIVIEGARTEGILEEAGARGLFNKDTFYLIHGDATGGARTTVSKKSNYDIITEFLNAYRTHENKTVKFRIAVPRSNPPIRARHNLVNSLMRNVHGNHRLFVYQGCPVTDEGFRLTKLRERGQYIEDDSKYYQHVTTAAGYGIWWNEKIGIARNQGMVQL